MDDSIVQVELGFLGALAAFMSDFESNVAVTLLLQVLVVLFFGLLLLQVAQERFELRMFSDMRVVADDLLGNRRSSTCRTRSYGLPIRVNQQTWWLAQKTLFDPYLRSNFELARIKKRFRKHEKALDLFCLSFSAFH